MKRITCPMCDQTFKNKSGQSWHYSHIHLEPSMVVPAQSGQSVTLANSIEGEDSIAIVELIKEENQAGSNNAESRLETIGVTIRELQEQILLVESRMETTDLEVGSIPKMKNGLQQHVESIRILHHNINILRNVVAGLCRLVGELDRVQRKPIWYPDVLRTGE